MQSSLQCLKNEANAVADSAVAGEAVAAPSGSRETNPMIIARRAADIVKVKDLPAYQNYINTIPKRKRLRDGLVHPVTPSKGKKYSSNAWTGLIRVWRLRLKPFAPPKVD